MNAKVRIAVITEDTDLAAGLEIRLSSRGYQALLLTEMPGVLGAIYSDPPDLIIVDLTVHDSKSDSIIRNIKCDSYFSTIPVIGLIKGDQAESFDWYESQVDDFVFIPVIFKELFCRITLSLCRIQRIFDNNPLTRLPGNTSIQRAVEHALGKPMAVCYIDINHFKPYNDVYGFSRGDEVLRMLARIMFNAVKESGGGFSGHIGGDDFVFIVPIEQAEPVCKTIIRNFGAIAADLFDDREKINGYYIGVNRGGQEEKFPLLTIAIAVVPTQAPTLMHYGQVAELAAELKKLAKKSRESSYVVDRRKNSTAIKRSAACRIGARGENT
jgi:diguanylate cyclase (GGDEF)-like protein